MLTKSGQGVLGGLVTVPSFLDAIDNPSSTYLGTIVGLFHIGCLVGCGIAGLLGGKLGRTKTIFWGCVIMVVGGTIQASCFGAPQMIVGRIVSGIGNGTGFPHLDLVWKVDRTLRNEHSHRSGLRLRVLSRPVTRPVNRHATQCGHCE